MQEDQGSIRVRFRNTGEEISIDMHDLQAWIAGGHIVADDLINGKILTAGEWKQAGDMAVFHLAGTGVLPDSIAARRSGIYDDNPKQPLDRYAGLKIVWKMCFILAVIIVGFALISAVLLSSELPSSTSAMGGILSMGILLQGCFGALILFAVGAVIPLWIDIETNTRRAAVNSMQNRSSGTDAQA